jgi:cbb3-type cytochrome oxidase subunit 1
MNVGIRLLQVAAVYLVIGLGMGLVMAMTTNFALTSVHAHILLLGWATMALAGTVYLLMPRCSQSVLAKLHFWGHNLGLPVMMGSLALFLYGVKSAETVVAVSSMVVLISLLIFTINSFRNGGLEPGK